MHILGVAFVLLNMREKCVMRKHCLIDIDIDVDMDRGRGPGERKRLVPKVKS
jgi:hypothetical protein